MKSKKGVVWNEIVWWIVGIVLLALLAVGVGIYLKNSGISLGDKIKDILRFGR